MSIRNFALLTGLAYALFWIWLPTTAYSYDVECFRDWTIFIQEHGLGHAYEMPHLDYNPLFLEMLSVFGKIQGASETITTAIFTFKLYVRWCGSPGSRSERSATPPCFWPAAFTVWRSSSS
jgi:hypothetical protein